MSQQQHIDDLFFAGYSKKAIHQEMLGDKIRVESYKSAIFEMVKGKTVVDVGAGTGILSVMAIEAGAKSVVAIERSNIINEARKNFAAH